MWPYPTPKIMILTKIHPIHYLYQNIFGQWAHSCKHIEKKTNVFSRYNAFLKWYVTEIADVITPLFLFMILIGFRKKSIPYQISDNI